MMRVDERLLAEGWGALVGYDYTAGHAHRSPAALVDALRARAPSPRLAVRRPPSAQRV